MYPFIIHWLNQNLIEYKNHCDYDYVNEIDDIKKILFEKIEEIIHLFEKEIKFSINVKELDWERFCLIVNSEPYDNSIFFEIIYFDIKSKKWINYKIEDYEIEQQFIFLIKKIFNTKINFSNSFTNSINKINIKKSKKIYLTDEQIKKNLTIEL